MMNENSGQPLSAQAPPSEERFDIRNYIATIRKRFWIVAAVVAVGVTVVVLYTARQQKIYQATASVVIDPQPPQVFGSQVQEVIQLGTGGYWSNQEYYNTQVDILEGYDLARMTVVTNNLYENPKLVDRSENDSRSTEQLIEAATNRLAGSLSASQNRESRIVNVHVRHADPELAVELANLHVQSFLAYTRGLRADGSGKVSQFLAEELDVAEKNLRQAEERLLAFKKENNILSVLEQRLDILAKDIGRYTDAVGETRIKRIELASVRQRAQGLSGEDVLESPIFALASNAETATALKESYVREKQRIAEVAEELGPKHPVYQFQEKKVRELLEAIQTESRRAMHEIEERYQAAVASERALSVELERLKKEALDLDSKSTLYNELDRKQQAAAKNYELVLGRLGTSDISSRNDQINVRPHAKARYAPLVYPRIKVNIALAFVLSLLLGIGLAFFLDHLDRTLKSPEDVDAAVGAPLLGVIPIVEEVAGAEPAAAMRNRDLYVFENPTSAAAECCRSIRTNIIFSAADREIRSITISSARPREGKTTTTIYLGTTMAQSGQRVLLVDTDLRRPRLHKPLGVSRTRGVTNLILGDSEIEDVIKTTDIPNLYVLPCGPQPPNPAELLLSNRFESVLAELEKRFDLILLDSPPLLAVTDAVVLARHSDGAILITQAGKTVAEDASMAARQLRDVNARILGVILNDMNLSDRRYGYAYYSYGYKEQTPDASS